MPTQPAVLGTMRLGNFRLGYASPALALIRQARVRILVAGIETRSRVRMADLSIHDVVNDTPNTNGLTIDGTPAPVARQTLRVLLNSDAPRTLFSGTLQTVDTTYEGQKTQLAYPCTAIDDTDRANRRRPFGTWTGISATTIGQYLATFEGLSEAGIALGLPTVSLNLDGSEGFSGAYTQLAKLIGGYWKVEDGVAYLFETDTTDAPDAIDDTPGRFEDDPPIRLKIDTSQLRNRQAGKGHGEATLSAVNVGETIVPVANAAAWFDPDGGHVISDTQILAYTGVQAGGAGTVIGPGGVTPDLAPTATVSGGGSVDTGDHDYAVVFKTAVGRSLPSPLRRVTTSTTALAAPAVAPTVALSPFPGANGLANGTSYQWRCTYLIDATHETTVGPESAVVVADGVHPVSFALPTPPSGASTLVGIYRKISGTYYSENTGTPHATAASNIAPGAGAVVGQLSDANLVSENIQPPGSNTATYATVTLGGIALGPTGTTDREIHRTPAGSAQLKLLTTIANNTSTGPYVDTVADASLGVNAPAADTSGLTSFLLPTASFNPLATGFATDGAATSATSSAPLFSSALYTFVAADVGASVYIKAGTNWIVGYYRIVSVSAGKATLDAACASVASPTGATWGVNYSTLPAPYYTFTDMVIGGTTTQFTSTAAAAFFNAPYYNLIGNTINVQPRPGFTAQQVSILLQTGANLQCSASLGTAGATGGFATLGGITLSKVSPGATTVPVASPGPFAATGGWTLAGSRVLRYLGITGNTLTGVPTTGPGAVLTTIPYGEIIEPAPALTGVTGLTVALLVGAPINLWVQRDDFAAQATQAAIDLANGITPADGIYEGPPIVDERRGEASLTALCDATLALYSTPIVTVTYATRDVKTKSGKTVHIEVTTPPIGPYDLTIQDVTISEIDLAPGTPPKFSVTASSVRFTLEGLLRQALAAAGA